MAKKRRRGRPPLRGKDAPEKRINIQISRGLLNRLTAWRKHQEDSPGETAAARRLIEIGLDAQGH